MTKLFKCINCKNYFSKKLIDVKRKNWEKNPLCKCCSDKIFIAFNGE